MSTVTTVRVTVSRPRLVSRIVPASSRSVVDVQRRVQVAPRALPWQSLDGSGDAVAPEEHVVAAGKISGLLNRSVGHGDLRAGCDVAPRLHNAPVSQGDPDPGVCAQQATLPDRDDRRAAAREGAHDRSPTANVRAVTHHD